MVCRVFNDGVLVCEDFCVVAAGCDHGDLWTISPSANATRLRDDRRTGLDALLVLDAGNSMVIELDDGKIYRKPLYLMVKTMVSCRFSLKPIH